MALLKPTLALNFAKAKKLDSRISFLRNDVIQNATVVDKEGKVVLSDKNTPRFGHDPITGYCKGLLVEDTRTNILTWSNNVEYSTPDGLSWNLNSGISPSGEMDADLITATGSGNNGLLYWPTCSVIPSGSKDYYASVFFKPMSSQTYVTLNTYYPGFVEDNVNYFFATKSVTSAPYPSDTIFEEYPNGWYRIGFKISRDQTASISTLQFRIWVSGRGNTFVSSGYVWGAQVEEIVNLSSGASSLIPSFGYVSTRAAEYVNMTDTNFTSWYNQTEGTFAVYGSDAKGTYPMAFSINESASGSLNAHNCHILNGTVPKCETISNGVFVNVVESTGTLFPLSPFVIVSSIKTNNFKLITDNSPIYTSSSGNLPSVMVRIDFGSTQNALFLNGYLHSLFYYSTSLSVSDMKYLATAHSYIDTDNPSLTLDFINVNRINPKISYFRNDNAATRFNSSGVLVTVAANEPRFDYNPLTLAAEGILVEETKTNLALYSSTFTWGGWYNDGEGTRVDNSAISPMGIYNAATITATGGYYNLYQYFSMTTLAENVNSIFVKAGTCSVVTIRSWRLWSANENSQVTFNLSNGTITSGSAGEIVNCGNGWYRCSVRQTGVNASNNIGRIDVHLETNGTIFVFGAQIEFGSVMSSHIPTLDVQITRQKDLLLISGENFSSWFNKTEGTFVATGDYSGKSTESYPRLFQATNDSNEEQITVYFDNNDLNLKSLVIDNNLEKFNSGNSGNLITNKKTFSTSLSYKADKFSSILNDKNQVVDLSGSLPAPTLLRIGAGTSGSSGWNGHIKKLIYYPKQLIGTKQKNLVRPF